MVVVFPNELPAELEELGRELEVDELEEGLELEEELEEEPEDGLEFPFSAFPTAEATALPSIPPIKPKLGI